MQDSKKDAMSVRQQRNMETIEQLVNANQQLAAAHNLALNLFAEYRKVQLQTDKNFCSKCNTVGTRKRIVASKQRVTVKNVTNKRLKCALAKTQRIEQELHDSRNSQQTNNTRLIDDLEEQRLLVQRLTCDLQDSQRECERKDEDLKDVLKRLSHSEQENARLLVELETFQQEKIYTEKTARENAEQMTKLKLRIAEQDEDNKRHIVALNEAAQQIRSLELAVEALNQTAKSAVNEQATNSKESEISIDEFKKELMLKREARQRAIAAISSEMDRLKHELETEKAAHSETIKQLESLKAESKTDYEISERFEALRLSDLLKVSDEVTSDLWLQLERTDDLRFQLENEPDEHRVRINSLRRLSEDTRTSLRERRQQINRLKDKLAQIVVRLGDRSFLSNEGNDEIKQEAERQLEDVARSRSLSDERSRILAELKDHSSKQIHELKTKLDASSKDKSSLAEELKACEDKIDVQDAEILNLESQLGLAKADCRDLQNQMSLINSLFSQMLLGASSAEMDLDRLTQLLQENHDLISEMAKENCSEAAALPKLLIDIIEQVDGRPRETNEKKEVDDLQEENIAHNLPKVWRVLLELLSCHAANRVTNSIAEESAPDSCYKSVDTPTGPRLVISVSKTYIRLKELILEKKHLEKEMNRMKQLNTHLESKLSEQEKRLSTVSDELGKTWNIVGRMQAQHQQLHTHEKILRYELQQKRKMLQELKQELEYCREKWASARQKNNNTEIEWRSLRREFAARKALANHADSFNNSGESGFSDDREEESDEDETDLGKRSRPINSRKRSRKDGSRAMTPDTESEQPTDTELSESKTASSSLESGQRTPILEIDTELENSEVIEENSTSVTLDGSQSSDKEIVNDLDKALSNVICNLITTDQTQNIEISSDSTSEECSQSELSNPKDRNEGSFELIDEIINNADSKNSTLVSVFSIGPHLNETVKNVQFSDPLAMDSSNKFLVTNASCSTQIQDEILIAFDEKPSIITDRISTLSTNESKIESRLSEKDISKGEEIDTPSCSGESLKNQKEEEEKKPRDMSSLTSNEVLDARAARLKSLEEQAQWLVKKVSATNKRGSVLNSRLEELHETYGSIPQAPPMPDVLPTFKIQTQLDENLLDNSNDAEDFIKTEGKNAY